MGGKSKFSIASVAPFAGILVLLIFFSIATGGKLLSPANLMGIVDAAIPLIIGGLGMIFVVSQGSCDISQGSLVALSGTIAALAVNQFGIVALFPAAILTGACVGAFNGFILSRFKVSSLTVTLAMLIALRALVAYLTNGEAIYASPDVLSINDYSIKIPVFIVLIIITGYLFEYTRLGYFSKVLGENEIVGNFTGISVNKMKILAFVFSGIMASIVGAFTISRIGGVDPGMGNFFELQVMLALFIGGVPVTGGIGSRIYKLFIGAPIIALLENGLVLCQVNGELSELIEGAVLILVVFITLKSNSKSASGAAEA